MLIDSIWEYKSTSHFKQDESSCKWVEMGEGKVFATFEFVSSQTDELRGKSVIIFAKDRNFYIQIFEKKAYWGPKLDDINNLLCNGNWKVISTNSELIFLIIFYF